MSDERGGSYKRNPKDGFQRNEIRWCMRCMKNILHRTSQYHGIILHECLRCEERDRDSAAAQAPHTISP